jgi:hypothetical protein
VVLLRTAYLVVLGDAGDPVAPCDEEPLVDWSLAGAAPEDAGCGAWEPVDEDWSLEDELEGAALDGALLSLGVAFWLLLMGWSLACDCDCAGSLWDDVAGLSPAKAAIGRSSANAATIGRSFMPWSFREG